MVRDFMACSAMHSHSRARSLPTWMTMVLTCARDSGTLLLAALSAHSTTLDSNLLSGARPDSTRDDVLNRASVGEGMPSVMVWPPPSTVCRESQQNHKAFFEGLRLHR
jgi:hypothetical protein